jgi:hypothetical protein
MIKTRKDIILDFNLGKEVELDIVNTIPENFIMYSIAHLEEHLNFSLKELIEFFVNDELIVKKAPYCSGLKDEYIADLDLLAEGAKFQDVLNWTLADRIKKVMLKNMNLIGKTIAYDFAMIAQNREAEYEADLYKFLDSMDATDYDTMAEMFNEVLIALEEYEIKKSSKSVKEAKAETKTASLLDGKVVITYDNSLNLDESDLEDAIYLTILSKIFAL